MPKFYVYRTTGTWEREYLTIRYFEFRWLSMDAFDDRKQQKNAATAMTEIEATFAIYLTKLIQPLTTYEYETEAAF